MCCSYFLTVKDMHISMVNNIIGSCGDGEQLTLYNSYPSLFIIRGKYGSG